MTRAVIVVLVLLITGATIPGGEADYPTDYFRSPIGIPILLSATFAELRSNHFHSGLDIKTNGKQGYRVYAAADGYIVRILVSPSGNGNALYVRHPNGYTTVYVHLRNFSDEIQDYVKTQQYRARQFAVNLFPDPSVFPVKKGDVIALSGNSGGSLGPHLHFEIRDSATEWPLNPLLFGIEVEDNQPPQIRRMKIYAMDDESVASIKLKNGGTRRVTKGRPVLLAAAGNGRSYELVDVASISAHGKLGFGIETRDHHNGSRSRLGPYRISLVADESTVFEYVAEKFSFSNTRFINAHVDYEEWVENDRWVQRSYLLPGNQLPSYQNVVNSGIVAFEPGTHRTMKYEVVDAPGNRSILSFVVDGDGSLTLPPAKPAEGELVPYNRASVFAREQLKAEFPEGAFYEDERLTYSVKNGDEETYSPRHFFHNEQTPVHKRFDLSLKADSLPAGLRSVAALAYENSEGKVSLQSATYSDGWISARVRALGQYYVSADTVDPSIRPINISDGRNMSRSVNIRFRIRDAETGIASYEGTVDGKWVLFEYDAKSGMLIHTFDGRIGRGKHDLQLLVKDNVGNSTIFEAGFTR